MKTGIPKYGKMNNMMYRTREERSEERVIGDGW